MITQNLVSLETSETPSLVEIEFCGGEASQRRYFVTKFRVLLVGNLARAKPCKRIRYAVTWKAHRDEILWYSMKSVLESSQRCFVVRTFDTCVFIGTLAVESLRNNNNCTLARFSFLEKENHSSVPSPDR